MSEFARSKVATSKVATSKVTSQPVAFIWAGEVFGLNIKKKTHARIA